MGFLSKIGGALKKAASSVGSVVSKAVSVVAPAIPVVGKVLGSVASAIPVVGPLVGTGISVVSNLVGNAVGKSSSGSPAPAAVQIMGAASPPPVSAASVMESVVPGSILNPGVVAGKSWRPAYNALTDRIK
jgi:hypothetical protein